jgi:hypothetical protein
MTEGHPEAVLHAANVTILDGLRYAAILESLVEAFKAGGVVNVPPITTYSPWGKRKVTITVEDTK